MSGTHRACFRDHATFWNKIKLSLAPRFKKSISNSQRCDEGWFSRFSIALFDHDIFHLYSALWLVMWFACIVLLLSCGVKLDFIIHSHLTFFQLGCQNQITTINLWSSHAPPSFKHFLFYSICGKIERTKRITYYSPILTTTRCLLSQTRKNIRRIREPKRYNIIIALLPYKGGEVRVNAQEWLLNAVWKRVIKSD